MLAGENEHRDSFGNADVLRPGDVQWMTAGGGVIHSEMPTDALSARRRRAGRFQIWVNLPAADKMMTPRYQTLRADEIPRATQRGRASRSARDRGRVARPRRRGSTRACRSRCCTSRSQPGGALTQSVPAEQNGLIYVFKGAARIGSERREVREGQAALLESGDQRRASPSTRTRAAPAEMLLLSGKPLNEPVARYGPFVMNTREQIEQAFRDYQSGRFGVIPQTHRIVSPPSSGCRPDCGRSACCTDRRPLRTVRRRRRRSIVPLVCVMCCGLQVQRALAVLSSRPFAARTRRPRIQSSTASGVSLPDAVGFALLRLVLDRARRTCRRRACVAVAATTRLS